MPKTLTRSSALYQEALTCFPAGVNSPVRAFKAVGGQPLFIREGKGSKVTDADGNEYIDYLGSWGPLILGHAHPEVVRKTAAAIEKGTSFGTPHEGEVALARLVKECFPSMELLRFVNSGTEATMSAIRLARGFTGRDIVLKFEGCYHGHSDSLLAKAGSGAMTFGVPDSAGVPGDITRKTLTVPYNDTAAFTAIMEKEGPRIAAVIVEPVAGNMGLVLPREGFLEALRASTAEHGAVLIFDEVITGFRVAKGGAQERCGIRPDLTTLGKVLGGGFPLAAYGGKKEIMEQVAPLGSVYQAGTLSGNPVAVAAGRATLEAILSEQNFYDTLAAKTDLLVRTVGEIFTRRGIPHVINHFASMFTIFFTGGEVFDYQSAKKAQADRYGPFFHHMLERGIYFPPSQFETAFVSSAHTEKDIEATAAAAEKTFTLQEMTWK
ncbi:MAG: glutamate-1-semialdehyde 2,1-aminomutase [Candidatus Eremiobacteraeota bacterium]|nr:glutamate-1-semialdehyde 2,1-aminomutase [Candidatus Eremiobacteraeota bacterium]